MSSTASNTILTNTINANTVASNNMTIADSQTTGTLNIANGASRSGGLQIANGNSNSTTITILGGQNNTGGLDIGTATVGTNTIAVNINSGNTTGTVTIGNKDATSGGNSTLLKSGTVSIQNDATTSGTVNIKNGATSTGDINIKSGTSAGGVINIANGTGTVTTNIGAGTGTGIITIGQPLNGTNIKSGTVNVSRNTTNTKNTYIEMLSSSTNNIIRFHSSGLFDTVADSRITTYGGTAVDEKGTIELTADTIAFTGGNVVSIQSGDSVGGSVTIKNGASSTGDVNIKNGTSSAGDVNIKNNTTASGIVYIASNTGTVATQIGAGTVSGTVTIGNSSNIVQVNGALTIGTGKNITLQPTAGYIAPTADTMLGGITGGTFLTVSFPLTTTTNLASINLVKATYMVFFSFQLDITAIPGQCWVNFEGGTALPALNPSGSASYRFGNSILISGANLQISGSFPYSCSTAGTVIMRLNLSGSISSMPIKIFQAVRIA